MMLYSLQANAEKFLLGHSTFFFFLNIFK